MIRLSDGGPIYAETDLSQFPVEPFNTFSNVLFLAVVLYWYFKKSEINDPHFRRYLNIGLPVLFVGFLGGSIYHAMRSHLVWALMDVLPIYFIALLTSFHFWKLIEASLARIIQCFLFVTIIPVFTLLFLVPDFSQRQTLIYLFVFIPVMLPAFIDQVQMKWRLKWEFFVPFLFVVMALSFRALDSSDFVKHNIAVGTHWLWHCFGALTSFFVVQYLYKRSQLNP